MSSPAPTTTRTAEFLRLELAAPGHVQTTAGVVLFDAASGELDWRLRRDWSHVADAEDVEVLELLPGDLLAKKETLGPAGLLAYLEDSLSNVLRVSERETLLVDTFARTLRRLYQQHVPATVLRFETHLPLYSCRAAAGRFGDQMPVEEEGWEEIPEGVKLSDDMFVAHVVGRSMEPEIADGSLCIFRANPAGTRQGKKLLIENFAESEHGGQRYTIKRYRSEKQQTEEGWRHTRIVLEPLNSEFAPWELAEGSECRVIAEFVRVLA